MPIRNVHLTDHFNEFIEAGVSSGRFSNASEVVREGLRLLEQREEEDKAKIEWLRGKVQEGIEAAERGDYTPPLFRGEYKGLRSYSSDQIARAAFRSRTYQTRGARSSGDPGVERNRVWTGRCGSLRGFAGAGAYRHQRESASCWRKVAAGASHPIFKVCQVNHGPSKGKQRGFICRSVQAHSLK